MNRSIYGVALAGLMFGSMQASAQVATDVQCTSCVGATDLATGSVTTSEIANGGVRNLDLGANAVTSGKIKDGSVVFADLSSDVQTFMGASIANISVQGAIAADIGVAGAACPSDRIPVSASCGCDDDGGNANYGFLYYCAVEGNGAVAACASDALYFDPQLPEPVAVVQAVCLGATSVDGTPWAPVTSGGAPDAQSSGLRPEVPTAEVAEWHVAQDAAFKAKLTEMKDRLELRKNKSVQR